jgi:deoxyribodipyrimidine photo-lyase
MPRIGWYNGMAEAWRPGEVGAQALLEQVLEGPVKNYAETRNLPAVAGTSRLSPHLHFGEISPRQIWHAAPEWRSTQFVTEIGWREFAHHLLYHFPRTTNEPLRADFARFPWRENADDLLAWQQGRTGIPLVDAGMRELWVTGWMHNRVRMVVASFLVKNLRMHWLHGARWFWDTLVDADLASNTLGWQWAAGCGADAAPYFRVFNPESQAEKFDPQGEYQQRWLGSGPRSAPIVDLKASRLEALAAFQTLRTSGK